MSAVEISPQTVTVDHEGVVGEIAHPDWSVDARCCDDCGTAVGWDSDVGWITVAEYNGQVLCEDCTAWAEDQ